MQKQSQTGMAKEELQQMVASEIAEEKAEEISRILEMSDYMILSPRFNMALDRKDKEECLILLRATDCQHRNDRFFQKKRICTDICNLRRRVTGLW